MGEGQNKDFLTAANCHSQQTNEFLLADSPPCQIKLPLSSRCGGQYKLNGVGSFLSAFPSDWLSSPCFRPCMQRLLGHWPARVRALNFRLQQAAQSSCSSWGSSSPAPAPLLPIPSTGTSFHRHSVHITCSNSEYTHVETLIIFLSVWKSWNFVMHSALYVPFTV